METVKLNAETLHEILDVQGRMWSREILSTDLAAPVLDAPVIAAYIARRLSFRTAH